MEKDIYSNVDQFQAPASDEDEIYSQLRSWGILNLSSNDVVHVSHMLISLIQCIIFCRFWSPNNFRVLAMIEKNLLHWMVHVCIMYC